MGVLHHDGIAFSYLDAGEGEPLVLQHGLGGDASQPAGLYASGGRLVCLECRGHGETTPLGPAEKLSFETFAGDLLALADALGLSTFVLGGVSMGAGVALRFAAEHPDRVRGLILIRPAWLDGPSPPNLALLAQAGDLLIEHGPERGREIMRSSAAFAALRRESEANATSLLGQFDRPHARERAEVLRRMPADCPLGTTHDWESFDMPAVVIGNALDPQHPLRFATAIAEALPRARAHEVTPKAVDDAAHRREIAALVDAFLADPDGTGA